MPKGDQGREGVEGKGGLSNGATLNRAQRDRMGGGLKLEGGQGRGMRKQS